MEAHKGNQRSASLHRPFSLQQSLQSSPRQRRSIPKPASLQTLLPKKSVPRLTLESKDLCPKDRFRTNVSEKRLDKTSYRLDKANRRRSVSQFCYVRTETYR